MDLFAHQRGSKWELLFTLIHWTEELKSMYTDFVFELKCTIFWLKRGLRVHFYLYATDIPKSISKNLPNIPSNLYWAKLWCILLEERSQCTWISFTSPTELKSSSPLPESPYSVGNLNHLVGKLEPPGQTNETSSWCNLPISGDKSRESRVPMGEFDKSGN